MSHLKEHHKGLVLKGSQLNWPPWLDYVVYLSDLFEEVVYYTYQEIEEDMLVNNLI